MIDKKDTDKFVEELERLDEQFTDDLIEEYVDDIRHGKNRNVSFNEYRKRVIKSMTLPKQEERKAKQIEELETRKEASRKINGGGEEDE
jgi:hypothetical protein